MTTDIELLAYAPVEEIRQTLQAVAKRAAGVISLQDCSVALYQPVQDELVTIASSNPQLDLPRTRFRAGEGIAGHVGKTLQSMLIPDTTRDSRFLDLGSRPIASVLCVPILADRGLMGIITAVSPEVNAFSEHDLTLLETIAAMASVSISQLVHAHRLRVLNDFGQQLLASTSVEQSLRLLHDSLRTLMPLDLLQLQHAVSELGPALAWNGELVSSDNPLLKINAMDMLMPRVVSADELAEQLAVAADALTCRSYMLLPLRTTAETLGYLVIGSIRANAYGPQHLEVLETLSGEFALWLWNQHLYQRVVAQSERVAAVFRNSSNAIIMLEDGIITQMNAAAERLFGVSETAGVGRHSEDVLRIPAATEPPTDAPFTTRLDTPSGTREVEILLSANVGGAGNSSIFTVRDVTAERELDRAKAHFISMVSHELRTPLNSVLGFSDILLTGTAGELNEQQREFVGHIRSSSRHLVQLVNDILDLSRLDSGNFRLNRGPLLPGTLATQVVAELSSLARELKVELTTELDRDLPQIHADGRRIEQVLINLIGNALKFSPAGSAVGVRVTLDRDRVSFSVQDSGLGIPEEEWASIFERFYQPLSTPELATQGTGLGLTIAKYLVEEHGGEIWLESAVGVGSTFYFSLPVRVSVDSPTPGDATSV